eukprot:SAG11_NODE_38629_length_251_cov_1.026316_1_plen_71_part_01
MYQWQSHQFAAAGQFCEPDPEPQSAANRALRCGDAARSGSDSAGGSEPFRQLRLEKLGVGVGVGKVSGATD